MEANAPAGCDAGDDPRQRVTSFSFVESCVVPQIPGVLHFTSGLQNDRRAGPVWVYGICTARVLLLNVKAKERRHVFGRGGRSRLSILDPSRG